MYATGKIPYLKYSVDDEDAQFTYGHIAQRQGGKKPGEWCEGTPWKRKTPIHINELCKWQIGRQGLGFIKVQKRINQMTKKERERAQELCILFDKRYIRRTPT